MTGGRGPAPPPGLIDTPILVAYREGEPDAVRFVLDIRHVRPPEMSELSALALFAWAYDASSHMGVQNFLNTADVYALTAPIVHRAYRLLNRIPAPSGLTADDALIAATALAHKLQLYTLDPAKFAGVPNLTAARPY